MKAIMNRVVVAAALACLGAAAAAATAPAGISSPYDFQYRRSGEGKILPLQVFDNGKETYFQFPERTAVLPAILTVTPAGEVVSKYHRNGPYVVIQGVADTFRLQFGTLAGTVQYSGQGRQVTAGRFPKVEADSDEKVVTVAAALVAPVSVSQVAPAAARNAAAVVAGAAVPAGPAGPAGPAFGLVAPLSDAPRPRVEDVKAEGRLAFAVGKFNLGADAQVELRKAFAGTGPITKVVITGRDDVDFKEGLARSRAIAIRSAVLKFGVSADKIVMREGFALETDESTRPTSDISIVRAPIAQLQSADATLPSTVSEALALVVRGMQALVKLKALDEGRAGEIVAGIRRLAGITAAQAPAAIVPTAKADPVEVKVPEETWSMLPADGTAQRGLRKWADRAGMTLEWQADVDYPITAPIVVKGSVRTAINSVRDTLGQARKPLAIEVDGTRVIVRNQRS